MKTPPDEMASRLLAASEEILRPDDPPRLQDVAADIGASRASLYYYFSGRDDLVAFLLAEHVARGAAAIDAAVDPEAPAEEQLSATVTAMARYLGGHPGTCTALLAAAGSAGDMAAVLQAHDEAIAAPMRDLLEQGRADGSFDVADVADAAASIIGGVLLAVVGRHMRGADPTDGAFHVASAEQAVRSVSPAEGGGRR